MSSGFLSPQVHILRCQTKEREPGVSVTLKAGAVEAVDRLRALLERVNYCKR
jgi:hypothetical protein